MFLALTDTLQRPLTFTKTLRFQLKKHLKHKLTINSAIRDFAYNYNTAITFGELIDFIEQNRLKKPEKIFKNLYYCKHVKEYWSKNKNGSRKQCIELWFKTKYNLPWYNDQTTREYIKRPFKKAKKL